MNEQKFLIKALIDNSIEREYHEEGKVTNVMSSVRKQIKEEFGRYTPYHIYETNVIS